MMAVQANTDMSELKFRINQQVNALDTQLDCADPQSSQFNLTAFLDKELAHFFPEPELSSDDEDVEILGIAKLLTLPLLSSRDSRSSCYIGILQNFQQRALMLCSN